MLTGDFGAQSAFATRRFESPGRINVGLGLTVVENGPVDVSLVADHGAEVDVRLEMTDVGIYAELTWSTPDSGTVRSVSVSETISVPNNTEIGLHIEIDEGSPSARITYPALLMLDSSEASTFTSISSVGDKLAIVAGPRAFSADEAGTLRELSSFASEVAEIRSWSAAGETRPRVGVVLPLGDRLMWGVAFQAERWRSGVRNGIGPRLPGGGSVPLYYPISFDVGPDGRIYILDAGNSRIVVTTADGTYITEFGEPGSGPGQFDFGSGVRAQGVGLDYSGSIAVDDEGFIYVADVGNRRIQKFSPD